MFAQINHMALISAQYPLLQKYYQSLFRLKISGANDPEASATVTDGNIGLNLLPRRDGYIGGLDHFGMVVDDIGAVLERMQSSHPKANIVRRPSYRPFAAYSGHDPDGNVFDLAEKTGDNRKEVYAETAGGGWTQDRCFSRFAIRTMNAEAVAEFYAEVFELKPLNRKAGDPNHHLTDGRVTLSIMPWTIDGFAGMSIKRPGPDHIGMKVENLDAFKADMERLGGKNSFLASRPLGGSKEADTRRDFFARNALGKLQFADPDGNWIDVTDE